MSAAVEHSGDHSGHHHHHDTAGGEKDPVCGMSVDPATARHRAAHHGRTYFFCGARCKERFVGEPAKFLAPRPIAPEVTGAGQWTCPMHPEIVRAAQGSCPLCGMALEPVLPPHDAEDPELRGMTRRLWLSAMLSVPLLVIGMLGIRFPGVIWVQLALA